MRERMTPAAVLAIVVMILSYAATASAQSGSPTQPLPPPGHAVPPPNGPPEKGMPPPPSLWGFGTYPYDFTYDGSVYGASFKPEEKVSITADGISVPANKVVANGYGSFVAKIAKFTWVFCGPGGTGHAGPVFRATGDLGSVAKLTLVPPACPRIEMDPALGKTPPPLEGGATGSGTIAPSGTVVAVPGPSRPPQPLPTPGSNVLVAPTVTSVNLQGFGFVPGEHVTVRSQTDPSLAPLDPVHITADGLGRLRFSVKTYVPAPCSSNWFPQRLQATGDRGTSVVTQIFRYIMLMIACPVMKGVPDSPPQPGPLSPGEAAPTVAQLPTISLKLQPVTVHRGKWERATVVAGVNGDLHVKVRYPGHGGMHRVLHVTASAAVTFRWRIPVMTHPGRAGIQVTLQPGGIVLTQGLTIR